MYDSKLTVLETEGVATLIAKIAELREKVRDRKQNLINLYKQRQDITNQLNEVDKNILDQFSDIADHNALIESSQLAIQKLSSNGINVDILA